MRRLKLFFTALFCASIATVGAMVGCNSGDERLIETAGLEGRIAAEAEQKAANENLARRSSEMERDLALRQRFYQGVRGTYEGTLETDRGSFDIRFTLVPSLPPFPTGRVRSLDEVVFDLNNLHFNVQVIQWNPANKLSAVGCRFEKIRPDLIKGEIYLAAESCPNFYVLRLGDVSKDAKPGKGDPAESSRLAEMLISGKLASASRLAGRMQPTTNAEVYVLDALKVDE